MSREIVGTETGRIEDIGGQGMRDLGQELQRKGGDLDQDQGSVVEGQGQETGTGDPGPGIEKGTDRERKKEKGGKRVCQQ